MKPTAAGLCAVLIMCGCAEPTPTAAELDKIHARAVVLGDELADMIIEDNGGAVVRLRFDADVDLDLYVTDPLLDTTYLPGTKLASAGS